WITVRVWLGDVSGAFCEWSTDGGKSWRPLRDRAHNAVIDTRGRAGGVQDWGPAWQSGESIGVVKLHMTKDHYVAFGPVAGNVFIDDVIVERDAPTDEARSAAPSPAPTSTPSPPPASTPVLKDVLKQENLAPAGRFLEVTVPDTLDLAA